MLDFGDLFNMQGMLFSLMALGMLLRRSGIVSEEGRAVMTELILNVTLPCAIVKSFQIPFDRKIVEQCLAIFVVAVSVQVMCQILARLLYPHLPDRKRKVAQYGTLCSNGGVLGNPVAEGIFGPIGLLWASVYLIPQRIFMWSFGLAYFTETEDGGSVIKRIATHPCILAVGLGLLLMVSQLSLPAFLDMAVRSVANANTALSMMLVGTFLAGVKAGTLADADTLWYSFVRLILIPGLVCLGCRLAGLDDRVTGVSVVLTGMPIACVTPILAAKYGGDELFATRCLVLSTLLSMATIPLWCLFLA